MNTVLMMKLLASIPRPNNTSARQGVSRHWSAGHVDTLRIGDAFLDKRVDHRLGEAKVVRVARAALHPVGVVAADVPVLDARGANDHEALLVPELCIVRLFRDGIFAPESS
jgi:hypothetical protein